jgi:hypothetical protein
MVMIFLDRDKAFDKIDHEKMFHALERLNIPSEIINMIKGIYTHPNFRVQQMDQASEWRIQDTGIRQGCPLSPYLFILTMHVMFHDIKLALNDKWGKNNYANINFWELLYADDKSTIFAKRVLRLIEEESAYYDLRLNKGKCNFISFNYKANITFKNGDAMKRTGEATYLGATITQQVDPKIEIRNRISSTMPVLKKLDTFWNKAKCNKKWQIQVLNAVIVSKLTYGLETIEPTEGALKTLNAFHLKGLRKILNMKTTFVDRANTNEAVYRKAFQVLQTENEKKPPRLQKAGEQMTKRSQANI